MNKKYLFLSLFIIACYVTPLFSEVYNPNTITPFHIKSLEESYQINWNWYFKNSDDKNYESEDIDHSNWIITTVIGAWQMLVPDAKDYHGTSWYKLPIIIDSIETSESVGLYFPLCFGSVQIYFNEEIIYDSKSVFGSKPILVQIPKNAIRKGSNYLNLRVKSYSGWGGTSGFIGIGSYKLLHSKWIRFIMKNIALSFISLFLSIYFILHYIFRKKETYNLIFSGLCLSVGIFIPGYHGLWFYIFNYSWAYWLFTFIGGIGMYLLPILFIHSFFELKLGKVAKIFSIFYVFLGLWVLFEYIFTRQIIYFNKYAYLLFNFSYILLVIYLIIISINALRKNLIFSKMMFVGTILLALSFIYSMLVFAAVIYKEAIIGEGFFAMVIVFSIVLAKRFARTHTDLELSHALNLELNRTLEEKVKHRTKELKRRNDEIMESIGYAALIQNSILPSNEVLGKYLSDFYVLWKPKGVVGGDFYWFYKKDKNFLIAVVDCTGHGVPGALLTMTATSVLERIVAHINHSDPAIILKELNRILKRILRQEDSDYITDDGLDIGLCHYDYNEKLITYAGSKIRLHVVDNGGLTEIKGDRQGIGYDRSDENYEYTNHKIPVTKDKTFYMTTDGYLDQSGGEYEYGFGWTKYKRLLIENHKDNMSTQIEKLEQALNQYQSECEQRDDITLLGFRVDTDE